MKLFVIKFDNCKNTTYKIVTAKDSDHFIYYIKYVADDDLLKKIFQHSIWTGFDHESWSLANKIKKHIVKNNENHINWKLTNFLNLKNILQKIPNKEFLPSLSAWFSGIFPNVEYLRVDIIDQDDIICVPIEDVKKNIV